MTTLRGSFRALHRHLVRYTAVAFSIFLPQRRVRGAATPVPATPEPEPVASTPAAPMPAPEAEREQVGFILPPEPSPEALLAAATQAGEQDRADLESLPAPSAVQAPALYTCPASAKSEELRDTSLVADRGAPAEHIIQVAEECADPLPSDVFDDEGVEAGRDVSTPPVTTGVATEVSTPRDTSAVRLRSADRPPTLRDAEALKAIARLRMLSYEQLRQRFYPGHPSIVGRRMKKLAQAGWIVLFMDQLTDGGHPFYVFPTAKTMRWARSEFLSDTSLPHHTLIATMFPNAVSELYTPEPRTAPTFLRHQELTNQAAAALERLGLGWLSAWPRPFPHAYKRIPLPQPDLVFVASVKGTAQLFFGELDHNSNESLAHFKDRKVDRALTLAYSGLLPELTGFPSFVTLVVVSDTKDPLGRVAKLVEAARQAHASDLLAFTLAPWLQQSPAGRIWFSRGLTPKSAALDPAAHDALLGFEDLAHPDPLPIPRFL